MVGKVGLYPHYFSRRGEENYLSSSESEPREKESLDKSKDKLTSLGCRGEKQTRTVQQKTRAKNPKPNWVQNIEAKNTKGSNRQQRQERQALITTMVGGPQVNTWGQGEQSQRWQTWKKIGNKIKQEIQIRNSNKKTETLTLVFKESVLVSLFIYSSYLVGASLHDFLFSYQNFMCFNGDGFVSLGWLILSLTVENAFF